MGDYNYINPAAANDPSFMIDRAFAGDDAQKAAMKAQARAGTLPADLKKKLATQMDEGSLHTALFLQGVMKLKPWPGTLYRGERLTDARFAELYEKKKNGQVELRRNPEKMLNITSMSTDESVTDAFKNGVNGILKEVQVTKARDIAPLTKAGKTEAEVVLLPGALIYYESVEEKQGIYGTYLHLKGKQIR